MPDSKIDSPAARLLAVIRSSQDCEPVLDWAGQLSETLRAQWTVLCIETTRRLDDKQQTRISSALSRATELGADVITSSDEDPVAATLRVAAQRNVTQIIVGKAVQSDSQRPSIRDAYLRKLLRESGEVLIQIVPAGNYEGPALWRTRRTRDQKPLTQYLVAVGVIAAVTAAAFLFTPLIGAHATALVFLLTVVVLALFVERGPVLVAATMSAVLWEFFFLPPVYAFRIMRFEDAMLFGMYFVVALVLGHLTTRIRAQEEAERERETRATALFLLTRELNESVDLDQLARRIVQQVELCFNAKAALLVCESNALKPHAGSTLAVPENEQSIPAWVLAHRQRAGRFTANSSSAGALYIPLQTSGGPVGVLALKLEQPFGLTLPQQNLLDAFSQQIAMALDRYRLNGISEKAKLLAESERLSKTLLDSMSHEIRTPIAAIQSATGNLAELQDNDRQLRQQMIGEINEATGRLNRLVGNVLEASRLESGAVRPRLSECDVGELIHVALAETEKELNGHAVTAAIPPGLPLVPLDFVMIQQAVANLLSNAALHTPPGTPIEIGARIEDDTLLLSVADQGKGVPPEYLPRLFDKFYRVPNSRTGGTGLGLSLVKGFVEAHGGHVSAENRPGGGLLFNLRLPARATEIMKGTVR